MRKEYNEAWCEILNDAQSVAFDNISPNVAEYIVEEYVVSPVDDLAQLLVQYCHAKQNDDYAFLHTYFDELALKHAATVAEKHYQQARDFGSLREDN